MGPRYILLLLLLLLLPPSLYPFISHPRLHSLSVWVVSCRICVLSFFVCIYFVYVCMVAVERVWAAGAVVEVFSSPLSYTAPLCSDSWSSLRDPCLQINPRPAVSNCVTLARLSCAVHVQSCVCVCVCVSTDTAGSSICSWDCASVPLSHTYSCVCALFLAKSWR